MFSNLSFISFCNRIRILKKCKTTLFVFLGSLLWSFPAWADLVIELSEDRLIVSQPDEGMVLIPEGSFMMGSSKEDIEWVVHTFNSASRKWYQDETPKQKIYLKSYYIDKLEIINAKYKAYMQSTGKPAPKFWDNPRFNKPEQPVVGVNFDEAVEYCLWVGKRLPNEAEWEKAARGWDARRFPWGDEPNPTLANIRGLKDQYRYTSPAGIYVNGKSPYGVMDMAGNVWEWTSEWYLPYPNNENTNEMFGQTLKVVRGGSWNSNMDLARAAIRGKALPKQKQNYIGFRCVMQLQKGEK